MRVTILGSGTSQGVPTIGCRCEVCRSTNPRDMRLRCSAMFEWGIDNGACRPRMRVVIDAGPDFRAQMLRANVAHIDALLLTHEHKDHTGGLDDTRALTFVDYPTIHRTQLYGNQRTIEAMQHDYYYAFEERRYLGVPEIDLHIVEQGGTFTIANEAGDFEQQVEAIKGFHAPKFDVTGYRFGEVAYITDFKSIEPSQIERLKGLKVLIVNALRWQEHHSHFNVEQALALIQACAPERAYLTHISHDMGLIDDVNAKLPAGVELAYDNLIIEI